MNEERQRRYYKIAVFVCLVLAGTVLFLFRFTGCKKAILVAPEGTVLHVTVNPSRIPLGGTSVVTVIGNKASGTPVADGTKIYFSSDIGSIDSQAETQGGVARATFQSNDNRTGDANIIATSGNAQMSPESVTITVGGTTAASLTLSADPQVLPVNGGTSRIYIMAYDENTTPLSNIPVTLTTTTGQLASHGAVLYTGVNGRVEDTLQTTSTADVTASSGSITGTITITVKNNEPPDASFVYSPTNPRINQPVIFDANASTDTDGSIVSYIWNFGDGQSGSGPVVSHRFPNPGSYQVLLVVTDNEGSTNSTSSPVTITLGTPPIASFVYSPLNPKIDQDIYFNASASSDPDGRIVSYTWDFGDGSADRGRTVTHSFANTGTFVVLLIVKDDDGNQHSSSAQVKVDSTSRSR